MSLRKLGPSYKTYKVYHTILDYNSNIVYIGYNINMPKYIKRDLELLLKKAFKQFPAVIITGARQSGKSTLVKHVFPEAKYISLENLNIRNFAKKDPEGFLSEYKPPIIIDEIQEVPELLSYIKTLIDQNRKSGMFIITGSQQFSLMQGVQESLAGRAGILDLSAFSFNEIRNMVRTKKWYECAYEGFYPEIKVKKTIDIDFWYSSYIRTVIDRDISIHLKEKNLFNYSRFVELLAARCSQELNFVTISNELGVDIKTIQTWTSLLLRSQIIFFLPPYFKNLGKRITKRSKLYFFDTGLVAHLTKHKTPELIKNGPMSGSIFENMVISDIMKQNFSYGSRQSLYYFKENNGLEIDLLIDHPIKSTLIEIKSTETPDTAHIINLGRFQKLINGKAESYLISAKKEGFTVKGIKFLYFMDFKLKS